MSMKDTISANVTKRIDELLSHITGNIATEALSGGRRGRKDKEGKIKPLSYADNAMFMRLLARVTEKFFSSESPKGWLKERNAFLNLLIQAAQKFQMKQVNPQIVWSRFLDFLFDQIDPQLEERLIEIVKTSLSANFSNAADQSGKIIYGGPKPLEPQLKAQLKLLLGLPFMRLANEQWQTDKDAALSLIKQFIELPDDKARWQEYQIYLPSLEQLILKPHAPLMVWPHFLHTLFDSASEEAKDKLLARARLGIKTVAHHMSVFEENGETIQWLANPFIEAVAYMMEQSEDQAELFIKQFCELPDDNARLEAYIAVMAQPEGQLDALKRIVVGGIATIRERHDEAAEQAKASGQPTATSTIDGWLARARQFNQQS